MKGEGRRGEDIPPKMSAVSRISSRPMRMSKWMLDWGVPGRWEPYMAERK